MALLLDERTAFTDAGLVLGEAPLSVRCRITVEWLRGVIDPTWYGYIVPADHDVRLLPGRYRLRMELGDVEVLVRRPTRLGSGLCFPFWGLNTPPDLSQDASFALEPNWEEDEQTGEGASASP